METAQLKDMILESLVAYLAEGTGSGSTGKWPDSIADDDLADKLDISLIAASVNNDVYQVKIKGESNKMILRIPASGKDFVSYGKIDTTSIKRRLQLFSKDGYSPYLIDLRLAAKLSSAIVCSYVDGRAAIFPDDLELIIKTLAAIHISEVQLDKQANSSSQKTNQQNNLDKEGSLINYENMLQVMTKRVNLALAADIDIAQGAKKIIHALVKEAASAPIDEINDYETSCAFLPILKDANPGNFIIADRTDEENNKTEKAVVIDIEGSFYGPPVLDVGHAPLFSAAYWEYDDITPVPADRIIKLYQIYFEELAHSLGKAFSHSHRPPDKVIKYYRIITLGRCLSWMANLIYLRQIEDKPIPADKVQRAKDILSIKNLEIAMQHEQEVIKLIKHI